MTSGVVAPFPSVFGRVAERNRRLATPLLIQEGWTRHQQEAAKPPLTERTGWSGMEPPLLKNAFRNTSAMPTTPSAPLRWLRIFLLMAQPPLLYQEGSGAPHSFTPSIIARVFLCSAPGRYPNVLCAPAAASGRSRTGWRRCAFLSVGVVSKANRSRYGSIICDFAGSRAQRILLRYCRFCESRNALPVST